MLWVGIGSMYKLSFSFFIAISIILPFQNSCSYIYSSAVNAAIMICSLVEERVKITKEASRDKLEMKF